MPLLNPATIKWQAPTQNVDGTPINYALDYELGVRDRGASEPLAAYATVVGTLTEVPGIFVAPVADFALIEGNYEFALRAIRRDQPEMMSAWSNSIEVDLLAVPRPPVLLAD